MGDGQITRKDIISDEALNWGDDYKKTLEAAIVKNKEFVAGILEIHEANKLLRGSIDQKTFVENSKKINEESKKTIGIWKEQIQLENALIATKKKNELATESTNRELTKQRILLAEQNKAVKQEAQNQLGLVTVYQKVQNKLNALGKEYSDLSIRKNLGAKLTDQEIKRYEFLEKKITTYDQALKLTDATQGKHQRNVGNYTGSFNALNNSVNQISREMPAFANSMNTGFMAISNNIPAFFDALNGIKQKNIELAKSGQPTKSMLTELGGALFSVQSLMSIGVTLLTIYGARLVEWAANSLKTSKAIDQMALSTETLNKAFEDTNVSKAIQDVNQLGINLQLAKDGFLDKDKVLEQYNETIGTTTGLVSNLDEAEKELTENGDAYIKMTLYKAAANLALEDAAKQSLEAEKTRLKSLKEYAGQNADVGVSVGSSAPGYDPTAAARVAKKDLEAQKQRKKDEIKISEDAAKANIDIAKKFQLDAAKIAKDFDFNLFGDNKDLNKTKTTKKTGVADTTFETEKQRLERTIAINNDIVRDAERTDQERLKSLENSEAAQIELITKSKENQLKLAGETFEKELKEGNKTSAGLIQLRKNYEAEKVKITDEAAFKMEDIEKNTSKEIAKINEFNAKSYEDNIKRGVTAIEIANNEKIAAEEKRFQDELALGFENDKAKEKAAENHEKALFNIKKEGIISTTRLQINALNDEIDAYEKKAKQDGEITQKESDFILGKRKEVSELSVRLIQAEGTKFKENEDYKGKSGAERLGLWYAENKKVIDEITQISTETLGALTDLGNAFTAREIQNIEDKISKNNEYYNRQIELAGNDERQKDLLNKERDKKNEELEKKKRKAQEKQAKFDKAAAIAQATISASLAVLAALSTHPFLPMGPTMAILAGVLGAIQIATIIATPIPKYKLGRKGGPAEFAIVGDGGVSEVIERKSGKIDLTPRVPTLTHLGQGDIVHSSIDSYNKSMRASILASLGVDGRKMNEFQANQIFENDNKEVVK
ncbi:MAG: hypothetical protein H7Z76_08815, partial [Methylotenera sp.]|nr:hypothetical protein [Flavobacterium sp.]